MHDDPAVETFVVAHAHVRIRAVFRLIGMLATLVTAFVISLGCLEAYHVGAPIVIPLPFAACSLLGHLVVAVDRVRIARNPRIPRARVVR